MKQEMDLIQSRSIMAKLRADQFHSQIFIAAK